MNFLPSLKVSHLGVLRCHPPLHIFREKILTEEVKNLIIHGGVIEPEERISPSGLRSPRSISLLLMYWLVVISQPPFLLQMGVHVLFPVFLYRL